jgi:hypothetical protein
MSRLAAGRLSEKTAVTSGTDSEGMPAGCVQTCWRGMRIAHPPDWEPAFLSGQGQPRKCILVDRRYQRLEVHWDILPRQPDLRQMYDRLGRSFKDDGAASLTGAPEWTGLVRRDKDGWIVHAGRFFKPQRSLVQVVLTWPGRRDRALERAVLDGIGPLPNDDLILWQALGLAAMVPKDFELADAANKVGRLGWEFRRPGRGSAGLLLERLAMPRYWLKDPLGEWLKGELPQGFKVWRQSPVDCGGHPGTEIYSRRANRLGALVGKGVSRLDRAWLSQRESRVYRAACWRQARGEIDWPPGLEICNGGVKLS